MENWKGKGGIFIVILIALITIISCSEDDLPSGSGNHEPYPPYSPSPNHGSMHRSVNSDLSWQCDDPDGDPLHYTLYFSETETLQLIIEDYANTTYALDRLDGNTTYYWQVISFDNQGDSAVGQLWTFATLSDSNHAPDAPSNPSPVSGAIDQPISRTLTWACTDPDFGDFLNYSIYFDTAAVPAFRQSGLSNASFNPGELMPSTWYRWRVVAYDNTGDSTSGPIWSFMTGGEAEGVFAAISLSRTIIPVGDLFTRTDELLARFDSAYAPCEGIIPLEAEEVTCNEYILNWDTNLNLHRYSDQINFSFLESGEIYVFEVGGPPIVPSLIDSIVFPSTDIYITLPELDDTISIESFTVNWAGAGQGIVNIMLLSGNDTTGVSVETDNDGSYTFAGEELESLGGQSGEYEIMMVYNDKILIDAAGYDSRSFIKARIISVVEVYVQ